MWRLALVVVAVMASSLPSLADDLTKGVLLVHHPIGLQYTADMDYCDYARDNLSFPDCWDDVNPSVPADTTSSVWFVMAAWGESKEFAGVEFGFGSYDEQAYIFSDYGPCFPGTGGMEIPGAGWPGPLAGTSLASGATSWTGEYVPVYYFAGYGYSEDEIAIQGSGPGSVAKVVDNYTEEVELAPARCGILGIGRAGVAPCPGTSATQEVLARFVPGSIELPSGTSHASRQDVAIASTSIDSVLSLFSVEHIARTFPNAVPDSAGFISRRGHIVYRSDKTNHFRLILADSTQTDSLAHSIDHDPSVLYASPNGLPLQYCMTPGDPLYPSQWHLNNDRPTGCVDDVDIDAPEAWDIERGDRNVRIAMLDTPLDQTHPDFDPHRVVPCGGPPGENVEHGTLVAGVMAATTGTGAPPLNIGVAAVDWEATLICHDSDQYMDADDAAGIVSVLDLAVYGNQCDVINCSWVVDEPWAFNFEEGFIDAYKADVLTVAAMGNGGTRVHNYPASWDHGIMGIGSITCQETLGPTTWNEHIDVVAPGQAIWTTCALGSEYSACVDGYGAFGGTSLAAPMVTGIATLLLAYGMHNTIPLASDDLAHLIQLGAIDIDEPVGSPGWDEYTGWGRVNAFNSLILLADQAHHVFWQLGETGADQWVWSAQFVDCRLCDVPMWESTYPVSDVLTLAQYEVTKVVDLGGGLSEELPPTVWGRSADTRGLPQVDERGILWGYGFCEPAGTPTAESCVMRTYVYQDEYGRWFPCPPGEVIWEYSVCGERGGAQSIEPAGRHERDDGRASVTLRVASPMLKGTSVRLQLPDAGAATVGVFDLQGRLVTVLAQGEFPAGEVEVVWDGRDKAGTAIATGLYVLRAETAYGVVEKKVLVAY